MKFFTSLVFFLTVVLGSMAQAPTISAFPQNTTVAPGFSGATGTTMTITGTNFTGATAVTFGGTAAASFSVVNSTTITAVVGGGSSGTVSVTTAGGTATQNGFTYLPLSRIITDFGGYWSSTTASANATQPDDAHNLLGYTYNNTFYSTGVNDATLTAQNIPFTAGNYRALPVAGITGTNPSNSSVYLAMASKVDGNATSAVVSGVASSTIRSVLIDGMRGLGLGTGVTNLPASATMSFTIRSIDATKISDAEPDIIITQIADPSAGNDNFQFVNSSGNIVGNAVTQDMTVLASFGNYKLDLFSFPANALYNAATPNASVSAGAGTRGIRLVAFKLSDFGITTGNVASIKALKIIPSGNSDYAFIAYNANSINIPPNISQNDATTTSTVCANGTAVLSVIGTAASGGSLTYFWERSTNAGSTWSTVSNGGNFSGASTSSLSIINPANADQYRATVTESSSGYNNTSSVFTLTVSPVSAGGSVSGGATVCTGTNSTVLTLSGNTGSVIRWESSTNNFSTVTSISNTTTSLTATNLTAATQYRAVVQSGSCSSASSASATVTVSPVSVGGSAGGGATVCTGTNSTVLSLTGNTGSVIRWESSTNNFSTITPVSNTTTSLTASNVIATTQYRAVVQSGSCTSATSSSASVTVSPASVGGSVSGSANACSGTNSTTLTLSGNTGSIVRWESSTDNFSTVTGIANTTTSLTASNLTATTSYRAIVQNGSCSSATSSIATVTIVSGQWIGGASGDWSNPANWCGGVPTLTTNVSIPANSVVQIKSDIGVAKSVAIASGATIVMTGSFKLSIADGGTFINNGTFDASGSTGAVSFLGSGTITGNTTFNNIETYGALDFGTSGTITGTFTLQPGGSVTGHSPSYTCPGSSLTYNAGGVFTRGLEWASVASGPGFPSNVTVQNNTTINFPVPGAGYVCNDLTIASGSGLYQNYSGGSAPLTVGRNVTINGSLSLGNSPGDGITLGGNWTRNTGGVFNNNAHTVTFNSSANSTITAPASVSRDGNGAFGGETFYNININKTNVSNVVSLSSNVSVTGELKITKGTFDLVNSDVTVVSNSSSTAHVAAVPSSGASVSYSGTGNFIIQRHLLIGTGSSSRRWRLMTAPLQPSGAPNINSAWQERVSNSDRNSPVNPWPGFGTTITKSATYNPSNGFDQGSTENPSIYYLSASGTWLAPSSTMAGAITDREGYMLFARGNRSIVVSTPTINASTTILEPKGRINIGDIQKTLASGYQVIGNPYASAISINNVVFNNYASGGSTFNNTKAGSTAGITYYLWDPKTSGSSQVGKFISCSSNGDGTYQVTGNSSGLPTDGTIQSASAFLIAADNSGGTITFHETDKLTTSSTTGIASRVMGMAEVSSRLATNLFASLAGKLNLADGVINIYNSSYSDKVGSQDVIKMSLFNSNEELSIARDGKSLAIERRSAISEKDTIFLTIANMNKAAYGFQFIASNFDPSVTAFLEDKYTGVSKPLNISDTTFVPFVIGADAASAASDRFRIVFTAGRTLAITMSDVKAFEQDNNIAVEWEAQNQLNTKEYAVEKSTDGRTFVQVNTTLSKESAGTITNYNWIDKQPATGDNFYRIKSIRVNGLYTYSQIVKVNMGNMKPAITIYPNPVTEGKISLQFKNQPAGNYTAKIVNSLGQVVNTKTITHGEGNGTENLILSRALPEGTYHLQLLGPDKKTTTIKVVVMRK